MSYDTLLGLGIASSGTPDAMQKGIARGAEMRSVAEQRKQSRAEFKTRKAQADVELAERQKAVAPGGANDQADEMAQLALSEARSANAKMLKQDVYTAFDSYRVEGDTWYLNQALKQPGMSEMLNVSSIDQLNLASPADIALLKTGGIDINDLPEGLDEAALRKRFVRVTDSNGEQTIRDMMTLYGETGYFSYQRGKRRDELIAESKIVKADDKKQPATALVRNANAVAAARDRIASDRGTSADHALQEGWTEQIAGNAPGQHDLAEATITELVGKFGGEDKFFSTDFSDPKNFRRAYSDIARIERLEKTKLTSKDKTAITDVRKLISLADPASKLTSKETGILDKMYDGVSKYVSDVAPGAAATSAYSAFRNLTRNALFGATLTATEKKAFDEAFGTLGEQLGPVLTKFKTALLQTQAELDSLAQMQNPYSAYVRLGVDQQRLDDIMFSLQERIDYLNEFTDDAPAELERDDTAKAQRKSAVSKAGREPLSSVFGH